MLVWRYDRFARSTQLCQAGHEMVFHIMASLAQFESALISERVKAGMARAKAQGKRISRPTLSASVQQQINDLHDQRVSINQISKQLNIGYGTAWNYVQQLNKC